MRFTRHAVIFALGFFALAAQTLLFREYLAAFEGNEIGIGVFFASWLLWVAVGALVGRVNSRIHDALARRFEIPVLAYLPAFLLQFYLITHARAMVGVAAYEIFPFARMLGAAFLINAPVSVLTGLLFTLACRWASQSEGAPALPVALVYVLEALGSCAGGVAITLLLSFGAASETAFLAAALLLALSAAAAARRSARGIALAVVVLAGLALAASPRWAERNNRAQWERLLPSEGYKAGFATAQAKYLFGENKGEPVVLASGGVCESPFNTDHAAEVLATTLPHYPGAANILAAGPDTLSLCTVFSGLPGIEHVAWLHPDPDYPAQLMEHLAAGGWTPPDKLSTPHQDLRAYLRTTDIRYDLIILNLPDATNLVLNRYSTSEFFAEAKGALTENGVSCIRITGAANYLGGELAYLGSSMLRTLGTQFRQVALRPGDESWLLASDSPELTQSPALLRDRFEARPGAAALYPPRGLFSLYPPDRVVFQIGEYERVIDNTDVDILVNHDKHPRALLFSLLLLMRRAGVKNLTEVLPAALMAGLRSCFVLVFIYVLLRLAYLVRHGRRAESVSAGTPFDAGFLVFSAGLASMALSVVLLFLYQSSFGSLYLHIGLISALFMLGSFIGGFIARVCLRRNGSKPRALLPACITAHLVLLAIVGTLPADASRALFALLFALAGCFTGIYFPVAAHRLQRARRSVSAAASSLEMLDHFGGAVGACAASLFLLPLFGTSSALAVLAALMAANLVPLVAMRGGSVESEDAFGRRVHAGAYALAGIAVFSLLVSHLVAMAYTEQQREKAFDTVRNLAPPEVEPALEKATLQDGTEFSYLTFPETDKDPGGYLFSSEDLAGRIPGYGGPIVLGIALDKEGRLRDFTLIDSYETPAYLALLGPWAASLRGCNLVGANPFKDVDAVSGATITSAAILEALDRSGQRFGHEVLGLKAQAGAREAAIPRPDRGFIAFVAFAVLALLLRYRPNPWTRRLFLFGVVLIAGRSLNLQFSSQHALSLLSLNWPALRPSASLAVTFLVPILVVLFGNVYCGYLCPFGALQELLGELRPRALATDPEKRTWRYGRLVKYVLLFLLVITFAATRDFGVLGADPLVTFFSPLRQRGVILAALGLFALSFFCRRFWCRNLCPAGAFLALLNGLRPTRFLRHTILPKRCDLGVEAGTELDCICCDRCRHEKK